MKSLPKNVKPYKRTPEFTELTVPAGLLKDHQTKEGVWGKIVILEGVLKYTILEPVKEEVMLSGEMSGVVEPKVLHHIALQGQVKFYVEFNR